MNRRWFLKWLAPLTALPLLGSKVEASQDLDSASCAAEINRLTDHIGKHNRAGRYKPRFSVFLDEEDRCCWLLYVPLSTLPDITVQSHVGMRDAFAQAYRKFDALTGKA